MAIAVALIPLLMLLALIWFCGFKLRGAFRIVGLSLLAALTLFMIRFQMPPTTLVVNATLNLSQTGIDAVLADGSLSQRLVLTGEEPAGIEIENVAITRPETLVKLLVPDATLLEAHRVRGPSADVSLSSWRCLLRRQDGSLDSVLLVTWFSATPGLKPRGVVLRFRSGESSLIGEIKLDESKRLDLLRRIFAREENLHTTVTLVVTVESGNEVLTEHSASRWWRPATSKPDEDSSR